jgi:hypothetical protein
MRATIHVLSWEARPRNKFSFNGLPLIVPTFWYLQRGP